MAQDELTTTGAGAEGQQPSQRPVAADGEAQAPADVKANQPEIDLSKVDLSTLPQWRALEAKLQRQRDEAVRRAQEAEAAAEAAREAARQAALSTTRERLVAEGIEPQKVTELLAPLEDTVREQALRYVRARVKADLAEAGLSEADLPQVGGQPYYGRSEQEWTAIVAEAKALKELRLAREEEEKRVAALKAQAKEEGMGDRRSSGADRITNAEPTPAGKGLAALKAEMQSRLKDATGNRVAQIRREYRAKAREAGLTPDW